MIPEFSALEDDKEKTNKFLFGDYLITCVRHIYNNTAGYRTVMECCKTCYESGIETMAEAKRRK